MNDWIIYAGIAVLIVISYIIVKIITLVNRLKNYDATVWGREIKKFKSEDLENLQSEVIVFTGSSSINYWKTLKEDFSPLPVINRGFGGSRIPDVLYYFDDVVRPYNPKAIVFYAGENDVSGFPFVDGDRAESVASNFKRFCDLAFQMDENIPIYYISIKPPKRRKTHWPEMQKTNALIRDFCNSNDLLHYIDITEVMMKDGVVNNDLIKWDGIHMNAKGYELWTSVIRAVLMEKIQ